MIIRPYRDVYNIDKLGILKYYEGPKQIIVKGIAGLESERQSQKYIEVNRRDLSIDCRGSKIELSIYSVLE
jgi:hypothetical protein